METTGKCKHGEFDLTKGCELCIRERMEGENPDNYGIMGGREIKAGPAATNIVKVQYYSETADELSNREYTYFTMDQLKVGDIVMVSVKNRTTKARVSTINVPDSEIEAYRDKVLTITAGSHLMPGNTSSLADAAKKAGAEVTEVIVSVKDSGGQAVVEADIMPPTETEFEMGKAWLPVAVIKVEPGKDPAVQALLLEVLIIQKCARERQVLSAEDVKVAANDLALIIPLKKRIVEVLKEYLGPIKQHVEDVNDAFKLLLDPLNEADRTTRVAVKEYDAKQEAIRAEQERINRLRMEAAQAEMELKGELSESVQVVEVQPEVPKHYRAEAGMLGKVDHWKAEVFDFALLSDDYKIENTQKLNAAARTYKDKRTIPGVRIYNDPDYRATQVK